MGSITKYSDKLKTGLKNKFDNFRGRVSYSQKFSPDGYQFLFQIGHMRSGSSLLQHILCSNPMIAGYGETHWKYLDESDIWAVASRIGRKVGLPKSNGYFMDKVIHKHLIGSAGVINRPYVRVIFLIRKPCEALSSLVEFDGVESSQKAYNHYKCQLKWVSDISRKIKPSRFMTIGYKDITKKTKRTLAKIENFLELESKVKEKYEVREMTGSTGVGDTSKHICGGEIKSGINREIDPRVRSHLGRAKRIYRDCLRVLKSKKG